MALEQHRRVSALLLGLIIVPLCFCSGFQQPLRDEKEKTVVVAIKSDHSSGKVVAFPRVNGEEAILEKMKQQYPDFSPVFSTFKRGNVVPAGRDRLPDLSRWYHFRVNAEEAAEICATLLENPEVEKAFVRGRVKPANYASNLKLVPNYFKKQGYLDEAPAGNGVLGSWKHYKLKGRGITIADIEGDWYTNHHDLKSSNPTGISGVRAGSSLWYEHGTAELGLVVATRNQYGVTGIAHKAEPVMFSIFIDGKNGKSVDNVADAIFRASERLKPGDIIFMPIEYREDFTSNRGFAVEYYPDVFEAIFTATYKGIVVVEAAGNGGLNLDSSLFHGRFKGDVAGDSGAVLVGAGGIPDFRNLKRLDFSNFGSRLDVQNWGTQVVTTGYGDLFLKSRRKSYTDSFDGTSSATGITAGVCALMQEYAKKTLNRPLTPFELRKILKDTGTPQEGNSAGQNIGPRPDLFKALAAIKKMN